MPSNAELQEEIKKLQKEKTAETDKVVELENQLKALQDQIGSLSKADEARKKELNTALEDVRVAEERLLRFKDANAAQAELTLQELAMLVILTLPAAKTINGTPMTKTQDIEMVVDRSVPAATQIVKGVLRHLAGLNVNEEEV